MSEHPLSPDQITSLFSVSSSPWQLFEEHASEYAALAAPGPLKVGIQIRGGDKVLRGEAEASLDFFGPFFDCAAQLEVEHSSKLRCSYAFIGFIDCPSVMAQPDQM